MPIRSVTGCYTCRRKKKKCDEVHPKCMRCTRVGVECEGYAPLLDPDSKGVMRWAKTTRTTDKPSDVLTEASPSDPDNPPSEILVQDTTPELEATSSTVAERSCSTRKTIDTHSDTQPNDSGTVDPPNLYFDLSTSSTPESALAFQPDIDAPSEAQFLDPNILSLAVNDGHLDPTVDLLTYSHSHSVDLMSNVAYGPIWVSVGQGLEKRDSGSNPTEEPGLEEVYQMICKAPTPDPNTQNNALPFVLQSYAHWANLTMFEPLRIAQPLRDRIIARFSGSDAARTRIILMANVVGSLGKQLKLNRKGHSLVSLLQSQVHQVIQGFHQALLIDQAGTNEQASNILEYTTEVMTMQRYSGSMAVAARLMEAAAPVFRKACPDPPEKLINLPNILTDPTLSASLRYFAVADVTLSVSIARPLLFKYDVTSTPEVASRLAGNGSGIQWLHGIPSPLVVTLARINALYEDFGTNVDPDEVLAIEQEVQKVKLIPASVPTDPFAAIWRLAVYECWRQAVYVFLHMHLGGAGTNDSRVRRAVRSFTRLIDGIKPGRKPDSFLLHPMMIVGAGAYESQDQDILRTRLLNLQECTIPGTIAYQVFWVLEDIWERSRAENRPAVWHDLRIATFKLSGV